MIQLSAWLIFRRDHLLNVIILGVYAKRWPKCVRISGQKMMQNKIWSMIFFLTLAGRRPFHRKSFKWKKCGGTGLLSKKTEALCADLKERAEAASNSYSAEVDFSQCIYSALVAKNHYRIRLRCLGYEFFFTDIF